MKKISPASALRAAVAAAQAAGALMRRNLRTIKNINSQTQHDIKLELDVRCQKLIERSLRRAFPGMAILGEESTLGDLNAEHRWVVDPIDGTVNFTYGIPHACVSIALQKRRATGTAYETIVGVVYDPFTDELWTAIKGGKAFLNGKPIKVTKHSTLDHCIVSVGFAKSKTNLRKTLPYFTWLAPRVRKVRIMGAAALALTYVATGRFDAYVESGIRIWDIAAGGLIVECAGGEFWREPIDDQHGYRMVASNGIVGNKLRSKPV